MKVQLYMTPCARCQVFEVNLKKAIDELGLDVEIERIDVDQAIKIGLRSSPSIIIGGEIKSSGEILSVEELKKLLKENM